MPAQPSQIAAYAASGVVVYAVRVASAAPTTSTSSVSSGASVSSGNAIRTYASKSGGPNVTRSHHVTSGRSSHLAASAFSAGLISLTRESCPSGESRATSFRGRARATTYAYVGLERRANVDRVVDDVQLLDPAVRGEGGHVHDVERGRDSRRKTPVEVEPEAHRRRTAHVLTAHDGLQRQVRSTRVSEQRGVELGCGSWSVQRRMDAAISSEETDCELGIRGRDRAELRSNQIVRCRAHSRTLSRPLHLPRGSGSVQMNQLPCRRRRSGCRSSTGAT